MDSVEIMLKEYETLRQESLNSMNNRNTIISFGLATVGAIFAGSVVASKDGTYSFISSLALIVAIPIINTFVLFMWLGEYERMQRAGKFIAKLEDKINEEASKKLLTWETYLRESQSHAKMKYPYTATIWLLGKAHNIAYTKRLNTSRTPQVHVRSITSRTLFAFRTSLRIFLHFHLPCTHKS